MDKHAVALVLEEIAALLEAGDGNRFKARAFRTAARAVEKLETDLRTAVARGTLRAERGIGPATSRVIEELVATGESEYVADLRGRAPSGMRELLRVPGLGAKKIAQLHAELGIADLDALEDAARSGRIAGLRGFGGRTQDSILAGIPFARGTSGRRRYHLAVEAADRIAGFIAAQDGVARAAVAGAVRRRLEIVDGIIIVAGVAGSPARVAAAVRRTPGLRWRDADSAGGADAAVAHGRLGDGFGVEVRLCSAADFAATLLLATGSDAHVAALREVAAARDLVLDAPAGAGGGARIAAAEERDIYDALALQYVPPELRETGAEVALAARGELPHLVELSDLRGCFHCHTTASDGKATLEEMAEGALALGWRYLGIADHSQNAGYAGGLTAAAVRDQHRAIDAWNRRRGAELFLFRGIEADILQDGQLDYAAQGQDDVLEAMDYVVGSVHSLFRMERALMTRRMQRAVSDPRLTFLGHARGRLLLIRDGYDVDLDAVIDAAAAAGAAIEINADPHRLDMSWQHWPRAIARGVLTAINPDAHSVGGLRNVEFGVNIARKAGLRRDDVVNAWELADVQAFFRERKRRAAEG
jgi:DNA polymerase (family X)